MNQISTENLSLLPNSTELRKICKRISVLEAILCPEWEYRYYSYQKGWSDNEEFCGMRNGQGDQLLILFSSVGTCINGFAHESSSNGWRQVKSEERKSFIGKWFGTKKEAHTDLVQNISNGILDGLPDIFDKFIYGEPVKSVGTTFCIWQTNVDYHWRTGNLDLPDDEYKDGSSDLLELLDGEPTTYKNWAEEYYDLELDLEVISRIFNGETVTKELVDRLNPGLEDLEKLKADLDEIGYEYKL